MKRWIAKHRTMLSVILAILIAGSLALTTVLVRFGAGNPAACRDALYNGLMAEYLHPSDDPAVKPKECNGIGQAELSELFSQATAKYLNNVLGS